jgi:hypothetical protein
MRWSLSFVFLLCLGLVHQVTSLPVPVLGDDESSILEARNGPNNLQAKKLKSSNYRKTAATSTLPSFQVHNGQLAHLPRPAGTVPHSRYEAEHIVEPQTVAGAINKGKVKLSQKAHDDIKKVLNSHENLTYLEKPPNNAKGKIAGAARNGRKTLNPDQLANPNYHHAAEYLNDHKIRNAHARTVKKIDKILKNDGSDVRIKQEQKHIYKLADSLHSNRHAVDHHLHDGDMGRLFHS